MAFVLILVSAGRLFGGKEVKLSKNTLKLYAKSVEIISNELTSGNYYNKISAIESAGSSKDAFFIDKLMPLLKDPKSEIKLQAAKSLFDLGSLEGVKVVEEVLNLPIKVEGDAESPVYKMKFIAEENIRLKAATMLGDIGGSSSLELLKNKKNEETGRLKDALSIAVAKLGDPTETILFERALKDKDSFVRLTAVKALAEVSSAKTLDAIKPLLNDSSSEVRAEACRALGNIGSDAVTEDLRKMINDPIVTVKGNAVEALGKLNNRDVVALLKGLLEDENGSIRIIAAKSLGMLGSTEGLAVIKDGITNKDSDVKERVLGALESINSSQTIEYLEQLIDDSNEMLRLKSAGVLIKKINRLKITGKDRQ